MKLVRSNLWRAALIALSMVGLLTMPEAGSTPSLAAAQTSFSGQATVIRASVLGFAPIVLSDTGPLPSSGGAQEASLLEASVQGLLSASVLHAATVGQGDQSRSEASVANLSLTVAGNSIGADFLMSRASATCNGAKPTTAGSSEIVALVINGQSIVISTQPNQTVSLPVGSVVINEQSSVNHGNYGEMKVNALHVTVPGVADVIVSSASADITCAPPLPPCSDFVTGGGLITGTPSGARGNFGVAGGIKNSALWGHLVYIDHGNGMKVRGTGVTAYTGTGTTSRHIEGTAEVNGQSGFTYKVDVADNGEPGRLDTFELRLSNAYVASGNLAGGNIQLHVCK
jgi:hypothetical protein